MRRSSSTSSAKLASVAFSSSTLRTACMTVVWSRPPNLRPISGSERDVSCLERYIATWRGRATARARRAECMRSEEHTSELQSLMRISYAVFCLKKKKIKHTTLNKHINYCISNAIPQHRYVVQQYQHNDTY